MRLLLESTLGLDGQLGRPEAAEKVSKGTFSWNNRSMP
jgi:hypothetical protein